MARKLANTVLALIFLVAFASCVLAAKPIVDKIRKSGSSKTDTQSQEEWKEKKKSSQ